MTSHIGRANLINTVLPNANTLQTHALALANEIAAHSPLTIATNKLALNYARNHTTTDTLTQMTLLQSTAFDVSEIGRTIATWKSKQPATFEPLVATPAQPG